MNLRRWIVDGNNVMGSRPDRWWNDPSAGQRRLTQQIAEWCRTHDDDVLIVYDGAPVPEVIGLAGGNLRVEYAPRRGRDAADDRIVDVVAGIDDVASITVVTADRGLRDRLAVDANVVGPKALLELLA